MSQPNETGGRAARGPRTEEPLPADGGPVRAILGTAGHIDHGKTALVRALTGIETDRLPQEQERGISIELGFAHLDVAGVGRVGVIDVPGHERFIRQMLAGAHGFDLVLVLVAADDGVMPQTEEHFEIVHLLGVPRAIFVVTKTDLATASRIADVRGEIEILAVGTRFERAPVVEVSARLGAGLEELRAAIAAALAQIEAKSEHGPFRIPVDRVFTLRGHGTIVTGTALSGCVTIGDDVVVQPDGTPARVREIQVHGAEVARAAAGQRVALNLAGIDRDRIERGHTVTSRDGLSVTTRLDARVEVRPSAKGPVASHARVRVHHGTRETHGRIVWLDGVREIAPRRSGLAQLVLAEPLVAARGDRFILRDETASRTIGGGVVLLAAAERHRGSDAVAPRMLERIESGDVASRLGAFLEMSPDVAVAPITACAAIGASPGELIDAVSSGAGIVALPDARLPELVMAAAKLEACLAAIRSAVRAFHREHADLEGIDLEHLRGAARLGAAGSRPSGAPLEPRLFRLLVDRLVGAGEIVRRGNLVHEQAHAPALAGADDLVSTALLEMIRSGGASPATIREAAELLGIEVDRATKVAGVLATRGEITRISAEIYYAQAALDTIRERLVEFLRERSQITPAEFRDLIAASRKYCIPLLDWFDRCGLTIRVGDARKLRRT